MSAHFKLNASHRAAIEDQIESLIALLDTMDGDSDLEAEEDRCRAGDDGCGVFYDGYGQPRWGSADEDRGRAMPIYGVDQSLGPINAAEATIGYRAAKLGFVRSSSGG